MTDGDRFVLPRIAALHRLGASLRRRGERRRARELLAEAQHLADEAGVVVALAGIRDELLAAGGRPRRTALRGPDALTPAELRAARLAAEGQLESRDRPASVRHAADRRDASDQHLRQARDRGA